MCRRESERREMIGWYFSKSKYECDWCGTKVRPGQIHVCLYELDLYQRWSDGGVLPERLKRGKRSHGKVIPRVPIREIGYG